MDSPLVLIVLFTFLAVVLVILAIYFALDDLMSMHRTWLAKRLGDETTEEHRLQTSAAAASVFPHLNRMTNPFDQERMKPDWRERSQLWISQAGLPLTPQLIVIRALLLCMSLGGLVLMVTGSIAGAILVGIIAASFPVLQVLIMRHQRLEKMKFQLPDALGLMSRVIRTGQTSAQAILSVTEEFSEPIKGEFLTCYQQQNLGIPTEATLRDLSRRTGLLELKMFVVATIVQAQTGGNLAESLDELSQTIRDRFRILSLIRTITAEGRFQAAILLALPVLILILMMLMNWEYARILLDFPLVLVSVLVSEFLGAVWIWHIINFDF